MTRRNADAGWACRVCGLPNANGRVDCATCRTLAPGRREADVPEDETFEPISSVRVWLLILAIFAAGSWLASRVEFIYRWGGSLPSRTGGGYMLADVRTSLYRSAASLKNTARMLRAGNVGTEVDLRILRPVADEVTAAGQAGPPGLVAAARELRASVDELASLRAAVVSGITQEVRWREADRIERQIAHAEEMLGQ